MSDLLYSSAVFTLSQTTEFMRNKSIDNIIIHLVVQNGKTEFSIKQAYDIIHNDLPIRINEIEKSFKRSLEVGVIELMNGNEDNLRGATFQIPKAVLDRLDEQYKQLQGFLNESIDELFTGIVTEENRGSLKDLLLDVLTNLMAKYGYAYAGQLAGVGDATEFVPTKELKQICSVSIEKFSIKITKEELSECIEILFDRRDPYLNNLAFSICNRYYLTRLIGLDLPIDFITQNIYKDSTIYLDTNFILHIAFSRSKRHNEFREILKKAEQLGIKFAASEITIAEIYKRVNQFKDDLKIGEEIIPDELLHEVREDIIEKSHDKVIKTDFNLEESFSANRLKNMGVEILPMDESKNLFTSEELEEKTQELADSDRKYRRQMPAKNENALYHDAYLYFLIRKLRLDNEPNAAWFLTMDSSVIEHGIAIKEENAPPYSIRLLSFLQTLSQFVESQALKGEFADLFGELISKDLLPRDHLFTYSDLRLLIGFDIKAKDIPPEFVRKATLHIKKNVLKGGGLTDQNRAEVIQEFHKFLATPEQSFIEIRKKYNKKIKDRDEDIKQKDKEIGEYQKDLQKKDDHIQSLLGQVGTLERNQAKDKFERAKEVYNVEKATSASKQWKEHLRQSKKLRKRYIVFLAFALVAFTLVFYSDTIASWFNKTFIINDWIKYSIALIVFLSPFIRSFFEHKKVLQGFKLLSTKYRENAKQIFMNEAKAQYELTHKPPLVEDFMPKETKE